jgi:hypothetical protein
MDVDAAGRQQPSSPPLTASTAAAGAAAAGAGDSEHVALRSRISVLEKEISAVRAKEEALVVKCTELAAGSGSNKVTPPCLFRRRCRHEHHVIFPNVVC